MRELVPEEIDEVLAGNGIGVLALDGGNYPYSIPVAYGYDPDEELFVLQLERKSESYKYQCLDLNPNVSFTVYEETESGAVWQSVVLQGTVVEGSFQSAESAFARMAKHTQTAPNRIIWGNKSDDAEIRPYELDVKERTGRAFAIE